ncbi:MAG: hypothetical protein FHK80_03325 [Azoarcus sp. PHD]|nr:MAG: hypothetical protein FHK80_03325 [Azoarcus sp. PHD]
MSHNNDSDWVLVFGALLLGGAALAVWQFSTWVGLDMATGFTVLWRTALVIALVVVAVKVFYAELADIWPLAVAGVWIAWWPALDYWALQSGGIPVWAGFEGHDTSGVWWSNGYSKWGVTAATLGLGYSLRKLFR